MPRPVLEQTIVQRGEEFFAVFQDATPSYTGVKLGSRFDDVVAW